MSVHADKAKGGVYLDYRFRDLLQGSVCTGQPLAPSPESTPAPPRLITNAVAPQASGVDEHISLPCGEPF
jgi:hypothetical protein